MFCGNCATEVSSNYKLCPKCGGKSFLPTLSHPNPPPPNQAKPQAPQAQQVFIAAGQLGTTTPPNGNLFKQSVAISLGDFMGRFIGFLIVMAIIVGLIFIL
jgi:hypothetical protein